MLYITCITYNFYIKVISYMFIYHLINNFISFINFIKMAKNGHF